MKSDFAGRVVIITGASSGIGRSLAIEFAKRGAQLGLLARRENELFKLQQELKELGSISHFRVCDVTNRTQVHEQIKELITELGRCDVFVANAGVGESNSATDLNIDGAENVLRTNLFGVMYGIEAVMPAMLNHGGGQIVGISSIASFKGLPGAAAYCASKAGLSSYLESLRISLRAKNISVTTICPGFITTAMTEKNPSMLWVLSPESAAVRIVNAIRRRKKVYSFPKRMRMLIQLTRWLPDFVIARAVPEEANQMQSN